MRLQPVVFVRGALAALLVLGFACKQAATSTDAGDTTDDGMDASYPDRHWYPNSRPDAGVDAGPPEQHFHAVLSGGQISPDLDGVTTYGAADFTLDSTHTKLHAVLDFNDPKPVVAHIHTAEPGQNGPAIIQINPPTPKAPIDFDVTPELLTKLQQGLLYVDLHTLDHLQTGALRGQILGPDEVLYEARLSGAEASKPHATTVSARLFLVVDQNTYGYYYFFNMAGQTAAKLQVNDLSGKTVLALDPSASGKKDGTPPEPFGKLNTEQLAQLQQGELIAQVVVDGTDEELDGTLMEPGAKLLVTQPSADQVRPATNSTNTASARFILNYQQNQLTTDIQTSTTPTRIELRRTSLGAPGDPLVALGANLKATVPSLKQDVVQALLSGRVYLNIASAQFPTGELWGQVMLPGEQLFTAQLTPYELGSHIATGTGAAFAFLNVDNQVRYFFTTNGLPVSTVFIEESLPLVPPKGGGVSLQHPAGEMAGVLPSFSSDPSNLAKRLWRIRIGTQAHPNGEIAGQFLVPGETLYVAHLTGAQVIPAVVTDNSGIALVAVDSKLKASVVVATNATVSSINACQAWGGLAAVPTKCSMGVAANDGSGQSPYWTGNVWAPDAGIKQGQWYLEVRNNDPLNYPNGELRGQLLRPGEQLFVAQLNGDNEYPTVDTTAYGTVSMILSQKQDTISYVGQINGILGAEPDAFGDIVPSDVHVAFAQPGKATQTSPAPVLLTSRANGTTITVGTAAGMPQSQMADAGLLSHLMGPVPDAVIEVSDGAYPFDELPHGEIRGPLLGM